MFAAIIGSITEVVEAIGKFWDVLKAITGVGRILSGIKCAIEWYSWLMSIQMIVKKLKSVDLPKDKILKVLGLDTIFQTKNINSIEKKLAKNLTIIQQKIQLAKELTERAKLPPSALAGVHKPPYTSIAISEVLYDFSNIAGTGSMIIMFNPAGFGNKPKVPQIVRYVSEDEFAEFINSSSWGNYWRLNYLLGKRSRNKFRRSKIVSDIMNENEYPLPKSENLDDYVERVLDLPEWGDDIVAAEFKELIQTGLNKSVEQTEMMQRAIEKGNLGRGVEERGLRVTSVLSDKEKEIPSHLIRLVQTNPIFKDAAKVTASYKKVLTRTRGLRDALHNAAHLWPLTISEALGASNFGVMSLFGLEAGVTEQAPSLNFLQESGLITASASKYNVMKQSQQAVFDKLAYKKASGGTYSYEAYKRKRASEAKRRHGKEWDRTEKRWVTTPGGRTEEYWLSKTKTKEQWESEFADKIAKFKEDFVAEELKKLGLESFKWSNLIKPPLCVPGFK